MQLQRRQGGIHSEAIWLFSILAVFLTVNLLTASLSPTVWMDEVTLSDPAINLRLFGRFTSSAWYVQSDQDFWSGYPPLYSLLLSTWLWLAPISPTGVRSLNFVLMALSCLTLWSALRHSQIVRTQSARLLFVTLILCGFSTSFSYRSGRPDTLGVLLVSLLALLVICKSSRLRLALIFAVGSLLPWAGLQLVIYVAILTAITVFAHSDCLRHLGRLLQRLRGHRWLGFAGNQAKSSAEEARPRADQSTPSQLLPAKKSG